MEMHIDILSEYFKCSIYGCDDDPINMERFILKELGEHSGGMGRGSFEEVEFDFFTNGRDFEIVLDPEDLESDKFHYFFYRLNSIFGWWAGENFVKSLGLDKYIDEEQISRYEARDTNLFNPFLDLEFCSFVIYTYPESSDIKKFLIEKKYLFSWNDFPENDNKTHQKLRLHAFLKKNFSLDWVKTAKIEKIDGIGTIKLSYEKLSFIKS